MPIFESTGSNDPLGLWDTAPQTVSFGIGDDVPAQTEAPVYRVNLPAEAETAQTALAENLSRLARMNVALAAIPAQLDGLVQKTLKTASGVSFAVTDLEPVPGPEGELLALLADTDAAARSGTSTEGVSFGLEAVASVPLAGTGAFGQAKAKFDALLEQVNHEVLHFAWVETKVAGQIIARTEVDWSGDANTVWAADISAEQMTLHQRALDMVAQTRNLKLRLFVTVSGGAAKVAVLLATPGGAVLALPAVYQYVLKILEQARQLQSIQSS
jgi:hypothetical protein